MSSRLARALILGMLLVGGACARPVKSTVPVEPPKPEAKVTVEELLEDYQKNEIAADQKYKGKLIQVSGKVTDVKKAPLLGYYVGLGAAHDGEMFDVMCYLDESAVADASKLQKGENVTLMGYGGGKALGVALNFKNCVIVK